MPPRGSRPGTADAGRPRRRATYADGGSRRREGERNAWILARAVRDRTVIGLARRRPPGSSRAQAAWSSGAAAAVFRDRLGSLPLCPRPRRAQADRRAGRQRRTGILRRAVAARLPPQPSFRLPPGLPRLRRLRAGAHRRRAFRADPLDPPRAQRPCRPCRGGAGAARHDRAVPAVHRLSALAPPGQRDGRDDLWRLSRHDRGHRAAQRGRRIPRPRRQARRGVADRPAR